MRTTHVLLILAVLAFVLTLALYFVLDTPFMWAFIGSFIVTTITMLIFFRTRTVEAHQHLMVRRSGNYRDAGKGGRFFVIWPLETPFPVGMRPRTVTIEKITCYTKDSIGVDWGFSLVWNVIAPEKFLGNDQKEEEMPATLSRMTAECLENPVAQRNIQQVLRDRRDIVTELTNALRSRPEVTNWGIEIERVDLVQTKVPQHITEALGRQAVAGLTAQAREDEVRDAAHALDQLQAALNNPAVLDRAVLLQIARSLSDALAQHK